MISIECEDGFDAREWVSKSGERHNIYVKGPDGEVGWFDLTTGKFQNKSGFNFGVVDESEAQVNIMSKDLTLHLGFVNDDKSSKSSSNRDSLQDAVKRLGELKYDGMILEINIGPSREIRKDGKSGWAKANLTVRIENPEDIESLYDAVSDMAMAMLALETDKLLNRQS